MKTRKYRILLSALALCLVLATVLVACSKPSDNGDDPHTHTLPETYEKDATGHWKTCSGCKEKVGVEPHTWSDTVTTDNEGIKVSSKYCTVCGMTSTVEEGGSTTPVEIVFTDVDEIVYVSGKVSTLVLRSSTDFDSEENKKAWVITGTELQRTGYHEEWSRVVYEGVTLYCATAHLTTIDPDPEITIEFIPVNENVIVDTTDETHSDGTIPEASYYSYPYTNAADRSYYIAGYLENGTPLTRTGVYYEPAADGTIDESIGWSRIEIDGKEYYIRNSLLRPDESGSEDNVEGEEPIFDFLNSDISDFINMPEYKGRLYEIPAKIVITEEYFKQELDREIILYGEYNEVRTGTVKESDIVKIKFVGYINGKTFEGGSGDAEYFTIYDGGGFIDGFAEGIIGAEVGKEFYIDVTFPDDYYPEEFAGKAATFKVTVEFIYEAKEITDELIKELSYGEMETYEEFKNYAWEYLQKAAESYYEDSKANAVWNYIVENATAKNIPEELIGKYYDRTIAYYKELAEDYSMTLEELFENFEISLESIREEAIEEIIYQTVLYTIIKEENITLTDEIFDQYLDELAEETGLSKDIILTYYDEAELRDLFLLTYVVDVVVEMNSFVDIQN